MGGSSCLTWREPAARGGAKVLRLFILMDADTEILRNQAYMCPNPDHFLPSHTTHTSPDSKAHKHTS